MDSIAFKVKRGDAILAFKESFKGRDMIGFPPKGIDKEELKYINYGFGESI